MARVFFILSVCAALMCQSGNIMASEPSIYSKLKTPSPLGKDRILAVCVPTTLDDTTLEAFYDGVDIDGFADRQLTVVEVYKRRITSVILSDDTSKTQRLNHDDFGKRLRSTVNCQNALEFILIGKDTGVKHRWQAKPEMSEIFALIDAMPMRKFEMRKQQRDKN